MRCLCSDKKLCCFVLVFDLMTNAISLPPSLPQLEHTEQAALAGGPGGGHGESTGAGRAEVPKEASG